MLDDKEEKYFENRIATSIELELGTLLTIARSLFATEGNN